MPHDRLEILKKQFLAPAAARRGGSFLEDRQAAPSDDQILQAIVGRTIELSADEALAETKATTADDYDNLVYSALLARQLGKIQRDDGGTIEHPTVRVFRLGIESIRAGKSSPIFLGLLDEFAKRAKSNDALHLVFPRDFPKPISKRQMHSAEKRDWIVRKYVTFLVKHSRRRNNRFGDLKEEFKKRMEIESISPKQVDRALDHAGINFPAPRGAKKKPIPPKVV